MAIYTVRWFDRWAKKNGLDDRTLCAAIKEVQAGLYEADLGGGLIKKRVARPGQGKSGGFRTLIATNKNNRWVFVFGFEKNVRSNIDRDEEAALKKLASHLLGLKAAGLEAALNANEIREVICDA